MLSDRALGSALLLFMLAQPSSAAGGRVAIDDISRRHRLSIATRTDSAIVLRGAGRLLTFHSGSRRLIFDDVLIMLNGPAQRHGKTWTIAQADADAVVGPLLAPPPGPAREHRFTVVLDPGHGGRDSGAIGCCRVFEKKVNLDIAKRVRKTLKKSGVRVKLTRSRDSTLSLAARAARARRWRADVFVSIHGNSAANGNAAGLETYILPLRGFPSTAGGTARPEAHPGNLHDRANMFLSYCIHKHTLTRSGCADRGIRRARFGVIKNAPCPAALIEVGFLTNAFEAAKLIDRRYRQALASGIAEGILQFLARGKSAETPRRDSRSAPDRGGVSGRPRVVGHDTRLPGRSHAKAGHGIRQGAI